MLALNKIKFKTIDTTDNISETKRLIALPSVTTSEKARVMTLNLAFDHEVPTGLNRPTKICKTLAEAEKTKCSRPVVAKVLPSCPMPKLCPDQLPRRPPPKITLFDSSTSYFYGGFSSSLSQSVDD